MEKRRNLVGSTVEVTYNFVLEPILACLYGFYVLHIPHGILGVAVSVPLVTAFFLSRMLMSAVTPPPPFTISSNAPDKVQRSSADSRRLLVMLATIPIAAGLGFGLVMGISSGIYALIGLHDYAVSSFHFAANSLGCAFLVSVVYMTIGLARSRSAKMLFLGLTSKTINVIWKAICLPNILSALILRDSAWPSLQA